MRETVTESTRAVKIWHYVAESATTHQELDQILRKWAILSQFQADLDRYHFLEEIIHN